MSIAGGDGDVGIGTASSDSLLQIINNDSSSYRFGYAGTSDVYLDADDIYFRSDNGGANQMTKKGADFGIGTTSPGAPLDVQSANGSSVAIRTTNGYKMQFLNLTK